MAEGCSIRGIPQSDPVSGGTSGLADMAKHPTDSAQRAPEVQRKGQIGERNLRM